MKLFRLFIIFMLPLFANAETVETVKVSGIYYYLFPETKTAEATLDPDTHIATGHLIGEKYTGDIVIPSEFEYDNITYTVKSIGYGCFSTSPGITSITIPYTITEIKTNAFKGCENLSKVIIKDLDKWLSIMFHENTKTYDYEYDSNLYYFCLSNPLSYAHHLFLNDKEVTDIVVPDKITSLNGTFSGMSNLQSVKIPNSVTSIGDCTFADCSSLTEIEIPSSVTSIGRNVFSSCTNLETCIIPEKVTSIADYLFFNTSITSVTCLADNTPVVTDKTFYDERGLFDDQSYPSLKLYVHASSVQKYKEADHWKRFNPILPLPEETFTLTYIVDGEVYKTYNMGIGFEINPEPAPIKDGYTFSGWSEIPEIMPDHDVTVTGSFTINNYILTYKVDGEEYKSYDIEYNSAIIAEPIPTKKGMTFSGWNEIPETMPAKDVEVTGKFSWSQVVKDNVVYEVRDTINNYAVVVDGRDLEGEVTIKSSVEFDGEKYTVNQIAKDAFYWDTNVFTSVIIPDCITTIGSWAFKERKSLKKVEIGSGITSIGKRAFADIDNLETVTIHAENVPETDRTAFENSYLNYVTLYVPASSLGKYKDVAPWNEFKDIVALDEEADDNLDVITIKDIGKTTYCCEYDLDFTDVEGIKAYTATGYDNKSKTIWLTRVMTVPAGTGILVKGDAGTYKVPRSNVDAYYTNMFKGNTGDPIKIEETDGDMTNYYLSGSDGQFKSVNGSANIGKNKAYLQLPTKFFAGTRSIGVTYDDEGTTGIWTIEQGALKSERDVWYNLQGQRVDKPKKGLYIRNGRKVVVR